MRDPDHAIAVLETLKAQGMHICIDDFGTGYSSLSYLKRLPVETIKIDRSFVDGLGQDQEDTAIVRAVIGIADSLRLLCVAEGVETQRPGRCPAGPRLPHRPGLPLRPAPKCGAAGPLPPRRSELVGRGTGDRRRAGGRAERGAGTGRRQVPERGLMPQLARQEAPGSRRTRSVPERRASGGQVIGSTANGLTAAAGRFHRVGRVGHDVTEGTVHPDGDPPSRLGVVQFDPGDTPVVTDEIGEGGVESGRPDAPTRGEVELTAGHDGVAGGEAPFVGDQAAAAGQGEPDGVDQRASRR